MGVGLGRRARNLEEVAINMAALASVVPQHFRPLEPQGGDVFIACWVKSGTTMMQQMFHQLRSGGHMDFDDISRMTPWEDSAPVIDHDINHPQGWGPRGFKTHREYERLPAGMRYVVTLRDPKETYVSAHRFFSDWLFDAGTISLEEFLPLWLRGGPNGCDYFTHLLSWYARRNDPATLLTTYHWAVKHKRTMIARLAAFLEIDLTDDLAALVEERTSRAFMYTHKDKFDDAMMVAAFTAKLGSGGHYETTKVQAVGSDSKDLPPAIAAQIDAMWAERAAPITGHADFASLAAEVER